MSQRHVEPRGGFAWTPAEGWVVRGGAGIFADRVPLAAADRALAESGAQGFEQVLEGPAARLPLLTGGSMPSPVPGVAPSVYTMRPGAWQPASRQGSIGVERLLTADLTVSANYLFVRGVDLAQTVNINLPPPVVLTAGNAAALGFPAPTPQQIGRIAFGPQRLDPAYDGIFQLQPTASSTYHGVSLTLNRRLAHEIEWATSYTWSHATDTASDFDEQPQNPYALNAELAASAYDQRQRLVTSALFDLPIGDEEDRKPGTTPSAWIRAFSHIEVATILTLGSGQPVTAVTGVDDAHAEGTLVSTLPLGVGRHSLRLPPSATLDVRVLKSVILKPHGKLDLVVEAFNLLNRRSVTVLNPVFGSSLVPLATFGTPLDAANALHLQFSIDFEF